MPLVIDGVAAEPESEGVGSRVLLDGVASAAVVAVAAVVAAAAGAAGPAAERGAGSGGDAISGGVSYRPGNGWLAVR